MVQLLPPRGGQAHVRRLGPPRWQITYKWAKRRHPRKNRRWVVNHYYGVDQGRGWDLWDGRNRLPRHNETRVSRFVKVRGKASPFDPTARLLGGSPHGGWCVKPVTSIASTCCNGRRAGARPAKRSSIRTSNRAAIPIVVRRDLATGEITVFSSTVGAVPDGPRGRPYALADA